MEGYEQLLITADQLKALAASRDHIDRVTAATEIRSLAETNRAGDLEIDLVVTCVPEIADTDAPETCVRCFSMAAGEICKVVVPSHRPYGAFLASMVKAQLNTKLLGRLMLVAENGELLWQDEPSEVRAVLRTLAKDTDPHVLTATVAALVALTATDDGDLSGLAIEELHRLVLHGLVPDMEVIAEAFEAIRAAAEHGSKPAVDVFIESSWHEASKVRLFAVVGLEAPAKSGNERALSALLRSAADGDQQVRQAALDGLGSAIGAMEKGSDEARAGLASLVDKILKFLDQVGDVDAEVIVALGAAAGHGHTIALQKLLQLSHCSDELVACSAVRGIGVAAMRGSTKIFEALSFLAQTSEDESIRLQAVGSMGAMVHDGRLEIVEGLANIALNRNDSNLFVRLEAIKGLGPAVAVGNDTAEKALLDLMKQTNRMIRRTVVDIIAGILSSAQVLGFFKLESRGLVDAMMAWRSDDDVMIRRSVVACLSTLSEKGHAIAKTSLLMSISDSDEHVRRTVVQRLGEMAQAHDEIAADAVLSCAKDCSSFVRAEVAACAAILAQSDNAQALEVLLMLEEDDDILVRVAAQPGTNITTDVGDAVSMVKYSYEASRLVHHGLGAAAVPMLKAAVVPGLATLEHQRSPEHAIADAVQSRLSQVGADIACH